MGSSFNLFSRWNTKPNMDWYYEKSKLQAGKELTKMGEGSDMRRRQTRVPLQEQYAKEREAERVYRQADIANGPSTTPEDAKFIMPSQIDLWNAYCQEQQITKRQSLEISRLSLELISYESVVAHMQVKLAETKAKIAEDKVDQARQEFFQTSQRLYPQGDTMYPSAPVGAASRDAEPTKPY